MVDEYKVPSLHEALEESEKETPDEPEGEPVISDADTPILPNDWAGHPVTKAVGFLILIAAAVVLWLKLPGWIGNAEKNPWEIGLTAFLIVMAVLLITARAWRARLVGDWDSKMTETESKEKEEE